jgi:hypothetical protein
LSAVVSEECSSLHPSAQSLLKETFENHSNRRGFNARYLIDVLAVLGGKEMRHSMIKVLMIAGMLLIAGRGFAAEPEGTVRITGSADF